MSRVLEGVRVRTEGVGVGLYKNIEIKYLPTRFDRGSIRSSSDEFEGEYTKEQPQHVSIQIRLSSGGINLYTRNPNC